MYMIAIRLYLLIYPAAPSLDIQMKLNVKGSYNIYGQLQRKYSNIHINELDNFNS